MYGVKGCERVNYSSAWLIEKFDNSKKIVFAL